MMLSDTIKGGLRGRRETLCRVREEDYGGGGIARPGIMYGKKRASAKYLTKVISSAGGAGINSCEKKK